MPSQTKQDIKQDEPYKYNAATSRLTHSETSQTRFVIQTHFRKAKRRVQFSREKLDTLVPGIASIGSRRRHGSR